MKDEDDQGFHLDEDLLGRDHRSGGYYGKLPKKVKTAAWKIGKGEIDHGNTACRPPDIIATIERIEGKGRIGVKCKAARCQTAVVKKD